MPANSDPVPPITPDPTARKERDRYEKASEVALKDMAARLAQVEAAQHDHERCIAEMTTQFEESLDQALDRAEAAEAKLAQVAQVMCPISLGPRSDARDAAYVDGWNECRAALLAVLAASPGTTPEDPA